MERKISTAMKNLLWIIITSFIFLACSSSKKGNVGNEKVPDVAGTWYENGNKCWRILNWACDMGLISWQLPVAEPKTGVPCADVSALRSQL